MSGEAMLAMLLLGPILIGMGVWLLFGDLVNLHGSTIEPGVVMEVRGDQVNVLWEDSVADIYKNGLTLKSWFGEWELEHVVN